MSENIACCPELTEGKKCDYLDLVYRLTNPTELTVNKEQHRVDVEMAIHVRFQRCTGPIELGDVVYSTTLMPGEKVKLFSTNRRSRFSYDAESQTSYRHERIAEEQYYMDSTERFMSYLESSEKGGASSTASGETAGSAGTSGLFGTIFNGASVNMSGSFNAESSSDFFRELRVNAEASHNKSINMTRQSSATSIGEVNTRQSVEGETESQTESSSRTFENKNSCHAVTYLFRQLNKQQTVRFSLQAIKLRVVDPAGDSSIQPLPVAGDDKVDIRAVSVSPLSKSAQEKSLSLAATPSYLRRADGSAAALRYRDRSSTRIAMPMDSAIRNAAIKKVSADLEKQGMLNNQGAASDQLLAEMSFEFHTTIPTPGIVVKGCLDECNVCEPDQKKSIALDIENKRLQNALLQKQIELLENAQEYRCCPSDSDDKTTPDE